MSYRKQISYLELQENGQRIRGSRVCKAGSWEKEEILMVQLRGQGIVSGKGDDAAVSAAGKRRRTVMK